MQTKHFVFLVISALIIIFALVELVQNGMNHNDTDSERSTSTANPAPSTTDQVPATANAPFLQVSAWNCVIDSETNYFKVRGEVKNLSVAAVKNIVAVATVRTSDGTFVKSANALIEYQPLMAGQVSPFTIIDTGNPSIQTAELSFRMFFDGSMEFIGTKAVQCTSGD